MLLPPVKRAALGAMKKTARHQPFNSGHVLHLCLVAMRWIWTFPMALWLPMNYCKIAEQDSAEKKHCRKHDMIYDIDRIFVFKTWTSSSEGSERHAAWDVPKRGHGRRVFEKHMFYHVCVFDIRRYKSFYCVYLLSVFHIKIGAVLVCQYVKILLQLWERTWKDPSMLYQENFTKEAEFHIHE